MTLNQAIEKLTQDSQNKTIDEIINLIKDLLWEKRQTIPFEYRANSLLESRLTDIKYMWEVGIRSCGSTVVLAQYFLDHLGYDTYLVDGKIIDEANHHAWIMIKTNHGEKHFDLTRDDNRLSDKHVQAHICKSWWDLKEKLFEKHVSGN